MAETNSGMLSPYRVLDLTEENGFICGKVLGDLSADVIKIEKPGGDKGRRLGPFYRDIPHPEKSLFWMAFNVNKRGITLDIETADGKGIFKKLCRTADVVVESFHPGYLDKIGLGYTDLSRINPGIILASISGFGRSGPYKDLKDPEIVIWALSGEAYIIGESDRAPLVPGFPVAFSFAALQAAIGILVALYQRRITGEGQQVDAPALLAAAWTSGPEVQGLWYIDSTIAKRSGGDWLRPQTSASGEVKYIRVPLIYPCQDGAVTFFPFVEEGSLPSTLAMTRWVIEEGMAGEALKKVEWRTWNWQVVSPEAVTEITDNFRRFFLTHTKIELRDGAQKRGVMLCPVFTAKDILEFPQLASREFWNKVDYPHLQTAITYPGAFARLASGSCGIHRRAPLIGEHNKEIYSGELGLSDNDLSILKQGGVI